jgi:hypothetical protein
MDAKLNETFRNYWPDPLAVEYEPLNDGEARPVPPGPYCVYEKLPPSIVAHMSGADVSRADTENQFQSILVQFRIHAKSTATKSGKTIAKELAEFVSEAFDPGNVLVMENDRHVNTIRGVDFPVREGDTEWAWVLQYDVRIDAAYLARGATA